MNPHPAFDFLGRPSRTAKPRTRGLTVTYWQQNAQGRWERKA